MRLRNLIRVPLLTNIKFEVDCGAVRCWISGVLGIFAPSSGPQKMRHGGGRRMPEGMDSSLPKYEK